MQPCYRAIAIFNCAGIPVLLKRRTLRKAAPMTPLRKKIIALARKFDGAILTGFQVLDLQSTLNSLDDTLTDEEVYSLLLHLSEGKPPDILISATPPSTRLVKVRVDKDLRVTAVPAPFSRS
jgi:hypothetical protein